MLLAILKFFAIKTGQVVKLLGLPNSQGTKALLLSDELVVQTSPPMVKPAVETLFHGYLVGNSQIGIFSAIVISRYRVEGDNARTPQKR